MKIVFETRFAFFGKSGWRSETSKNPHLLYEESRLKARFFYFENITIPSLLAQSDPDFQQIVLSSLRMPEKWQKRLSELCYDTLGKKRCKVLFNGWGLAGRVFRRQIPEMFDNDETVQVAQVVLDDDDALSKDFVETCRLESQTAAASFKTLEDYTYISFPYGYSMRVGDGTIEFVERLANFTNLGLTLVAPSTTGQNPFLTSHKKIWDRHPSRLINDRPHCYIRTVHNENDSLALHADSTAIPVDKVQELFPSIGAFHKLVCKPKSPVSAAK